MTIVLTSLASTFLADLGFVRVTVGLAASFTYTLVDNHGKPVSLLGKTVRFSAFADQYAASAYFTCDNSSVGDLAISGGANNVVTVTPTAVKLAAAGPYRCSLLNVTDGIELGKGTLEISAQ